MRFLLKLSFAQTCAGREEIRFGKAEAIRGGNHRSQGRVSGLSGFSAAD
jgi:hypothetical protein